MTNSIYLLTLVWDKSVIWGSPPLPLSKQFSISEYVSHRKSDSIIFIRNFKKAKITSEIWVALNKHFKHSNYQLSMIFAKDICYCNILKVNYIYHSWVFWWIFQIYVRIKLYHLLLSCDNNCVKWKEIIADTQRKLSSLPSPTLT